MLEEMLRSGRSKSHINAIIQWIGHDHERISELMKIFLGTDRRMAELAAWAVGDLGQKHPEYFCAWYEELVGVLHRRDVHGSVHRNSLRVLMQADIPDDLLGPCAEACFVFLDNPKAEVAIRSFSIYVLADICQKIPELWPELKLMLDLYMPEGTAAIQCAGRKVLKRIP